MEWLPETCLVAISREDPLRQRFLLTLDRGELYLGDSSEIYGLGALEPDYTRVFSPIRRQPLC